MARSVLWCHVAWRGSAVLCCDLLCYILYCMIFIVLLCMLCIVSERRFFYAP